MKFIEDAKKGKTVKDKAKKKIGAARCLKYIQILKRLSEWFGKPFDEITQNDMERVIESLEENKFKMIL